MVVSPLRVVPLKIGNNNCKPGGTYRKTPSICKIPTLYRANFAEDRHQHSRGGLSKIGLSIKFLICLNLPTSPLCGWVSGAGHLNRCGDFGSMLRVLREGFKANFRLYFSQDCTEPGGCQGFFCFRITGAEPLAAQAVVVSNPPLPLLRHCRNRLAGGGGRARV